VPRQTPGRDVVSRGRSVARIGVPRNSRCKGAQGSGSRGWGRR